MSHPALAPGRVALVAAHLLVPGFTTTGDREMDRKRVLWGAMDISEKRPPLSRWHPDYQNELDALEPS